MAKRLNKRVRRGGEMQSVCPGQCGRLLRDRIPIGETQHYVMRTYGYAVHCGEEECKRAAEFMADKKNPNAPKVRRKP